MREDRSPSSATALVSGVATTTTENVPADFLVVHARPEVINKRSSLSTSTDRSQERSVTPPLLMSAELRQSKSRHQSDSTEAPPNNESSRSAGKTTNSQLDPAISSSHHAAEGDERSKASRVYHEGDEKSEALPDDSFLRPNKITSLYSSSVPEMKVPKSKGSVCAVGPINQGDGRWFPLPPRTRQYDSFVLQRHSVHSHDGVLLAIDVYIPTRRNTGVEKSSRFPTALHFTRFNRDWNFKKKKACCWASVLCCCCCGCISTDVGIEGYPGIGDSHWNVRTGKFVAQFCATGYVWVTVDVRGTGGSHGVRTSDLHVDEILDVLAVVQWVESRSWFNGKIISTGFHYDGQLAAIMGAQHINSVVAVAPLFFPFDIYDEALYPGGIRCRSFATTFHNFTTSLERNVPTQAPFPFLFNALLKTVLNGVNPGEGGERELASAVRDHHHNFNLLDAVNGCLNRDDQFLATNVDTASLHTKVINTRTPVALLLICGWMDCGHALGAIRYYTFMEQMSHSATHRPRLIIGPWNQGARANCSPFTRSRKVNFPLVTELLQFFDNKVELDDNEKNAILGGKHDVPVHYFTLGEERWKASTVWPPPHDNLRVQLTKKERENRNHLKIPKDRSGRSMREELESDARNLQVEECKSCQWRCNPRSTTGVLSRWNCALLLPGQRAMYPNRSSQDRHNLIFDSRPLKAMMEVTGHPSVTLYIALDARDAAVFVYLEEVRSDGMVVYITEGQLRLSHRAVAAKEPYPSPVPYRSYTSAEQSYLEPGKAYRAVIPMFPCSYQFSLGSRIRLSIASADADNFDPVPDLGDVTFTIFYDHSYLNLPEVKPMP